VNIKHSDNSVHFATWTMVNTGSSAFICYLVMTGKKAVCTDVNINQQDL
jgi:hypothetical protein